MKELILQQIKSELVNGSVKKGHPFRYFTLGTLNQDKPSLRTVVLRKTYPDLNLLFYTDKRSSKIQQIQNNAHVTALFYHPKKLLQIQIRAKAKVLDNPMEIRQHWNNVSPKAKKDYTTVLPPGIEIENPENVEYLEDDHHFCMVELIPLEIEYLRLQRPNHVRMLFNKNGDDWNGTFLNP
ncbi:Pyridoxamine 5'-phosphate oxidase [Croceitalea dokdonensis DOKDO 023]|uniref:Pyridoxamine 5'-phosphate oxidase n=1 Tax=Croceitalea dokdonensis DOKDO 023 TaxID=1300341 RepID=A0A0P7AUM1_9FLAO|nr:pyridoxamine 5'-phosphate oxidase family protein [Croceitalea dokdonensis]KPM31531.1 Pyridoxamine 5'-phosphate oxidase [Croceitalea dokdonensis DOKDO 023]